MLPNPQGISADSLTPDIKDFCKTIHFRLNLGQKDKFFVFSLMSIIRHDMLLFTLILDIGKKQFLPFKIFANSDVEG